MGLATPVVTFVAFFVVLCAPNLAWAFTNGTLLPGYLCGPPTDGMPKSLGGVLPFFVSMTNPSLTPDAGVVHDHPDGNGNVDNTKAMIAALHQANNAALPNLAPPTPSIRLLPYQHVVRINVTGIMINGVFNNATATKLIAGFDNVLVIWSTPNDAGVIDDTIGLDGTLLYAIDASTNARVGYFTSTGPFMQAFPTCGVSVNNFPLGIVHNQILNQNVVGGFGHYPEPATSTQLRFHVPFNLAGRNITFKGAAVTDNGFGGHSTTYLVQLPAIATPPPPIITQIFFTPKVLAIFFIDETRNGLNAATQFTGTIVDVATGAVLATTTTAVSPVVFANPIVLLAHVKTTVNVTIRATNSVGMSPPSAPLILTPPSATRNDLNAGIIASLCPPMYQTTAAMFMMDNDPDNACIYGETAQNLAFNATSGSSGTSGAQARFLAAGRVVYAFMVVVVPLLVALSVRA